MLAAVNRLCPTMRSVRSPPASGFTRREVDGRSWSHQRWTLSMTAILPRPTIPRTHRSRSLAIRDPPSQRRPGSRSQATQLLELVADVEFFHTADDVAYARIERDGHHEVWPLG